jgi:hypothetical protein
VLAWDVAAQMHGVNFDTHPKGWPVTKKRNAVVPVIPSFARGSMPGPPARTSRSEPQDVVAHDARCARAGRGVVPKTIRHSVATELRSRGVPLDEIAGLLGHVSDRRITQGYAKYDPNRLPHAKQQLSIIWQEVCASANKWHTNHFRVTPAYKQPISVARKLENV